MSDILVACSNVSKEYRNGVHNANVLNNISVLVKRNSFTAMVGPSGSGKTTLLNLIGCVDTPTTGIITIDGRNIIKLFGDEMADFRREYIGYVFQLFNLLPTLNVLENVMVPLIPYRKTLKFNLEKRAKEILEVVGLSERIHNLPGELSGGEQQRTAIARAMINNPKLMLADEPTGNLDSKNSEEVIKLLCRLKDQSGITLLLVTHNMMIASLADEILAIKDGQIVNQKPFEQSST